MTHITIERAKAQRIADAFEDLKKNHGIVYVEESVDIKQALAAQPAPSLLAFAQNFLNDYQTEDGMQSIKHYAREAQAAIDNTTLPAAQPAVQEPVAHTYASTQATMCACCGEHKHTPLRIDKMGGYVCLTCIDKKLGSLLGEFGHPPAQPAHISPKQLLALAQEANLGLDKVIEVFRIAAQPAVPDAITDDSESPEYRTGWNDCRAEMLKGIK